MDARGCRATTIVIGIDGSAGSVAALRWGLDEAEKRHAPVLLIHAFGPSRHQLKHDPQGLILFRHAANRARELLSAAGQEVRHIHPMLDVQTLAVNKRPAAALLAHTCDEDLLVIGTHGAGSLTAVVAGSTAMTVATRARCTVIAVPQTRNADEPGRGVVVGVAPETYDAVLEMAFTEAETVREPLTVVRAWSEPVVSALAAAALPMCFDAVTHHEQQERELAGRLAPWELRSPAVQVRREVVQNHASRALAATALGARLLVVGCRGKSLQRNLLGSVSHGALRLASCPVAIVHDPAPVPRPLPSPRVVRQAAPTRPRASSASHHW